MFLKRNDSCSRAGVYQAPAEIRLYESCAADKPFYFLSPRAAYFTVFSSPLLVVAQLDLGSNSDLAGFSLVICWNLVYENMTSRFVFFLHLFLLFLCHLC